MSSSKINTVSIPDIQGDAYYSPLSKQGVCTEGVVIGHSRRGFFIQSPDGKPDAATSCALFVLSRKQPPPVGAYCQVQGVVFDYLAKEYDRPVTQIKAAEVTVLDATAAAIEPLWLTASALPENEAELALFLNAHEAMLVGIRRGATFIAPSNPFADYVLAPHDIDKNVLRSAQGGVLIQASHPDRWYPGFKLLDYSDAKPVNVGDILKSDVVGPLSYRSAAWQIVANSSFEIEQGVPVVRNTARLQSADDSITVMTLNALNLDAKLEEASKVIDPRRDIDDDLGDGRFLRLARAIVRQARSPDIVALQEIQDNDGAELSDVVDASATYQALIDSVRSLGGPHYKWLDIAPESGADGGQPGGNIRNGFLFYSQRIAVLDNSVRLIAANKLAFEDSRKPLTATFYLTQKPEQQLTVINVHLASKRHQRGVFSPEKPGFDPKEPTRIAQAQLIRDVLLALADLGRDYYVTGDFNDNEFSNTLNTLLGKVGDGDRHSESVNLLERLSPSERYDYNHRGKLQTLMHGIVSRAQCEEGRADYEILHGNELIGIMPGGGGGKASDHAYTLARLS